MIKLFVYGTLKKGFGNHPMLGRAKATFLNEESIDGHVLRTMESAPVIEYTGNIEDIVMGQVWQLNITEEITNCEQGYKLELVKGYEEDELYVYYPDWDSSFLPTLFTTEGIYIWLP